ncbi:MAG: sigma-70 family RNA polymerase sigma factor [Pseudomonadota bacterium]
MITDTLSVWSSLLAHRPKLQRLVGSPELADETIQTVSEKLAKADAVPSDGYLFAMLRNAAIDSVRAQATRRDYEQAFAEQASTVEHVGPERLLAGQQALVALQRAINSLNSIDQELFVRAYIEQSPRADIAAELNLKLSSVEKRLAKARRHCLQQIAPFFAPD